MISNDDKLTPAMKQFHQFKAKYPDAVLFFRMGDFYETFYEDAQLCSSVLGLTLTSRSKGENPIPLAGLPYHAVDGYLKKMIQAGYKVAVCEQIEDPKTAKGVVKRDVVRVVTPGTLTDSMLLDERVDNFLCAIRPGAKGSDLAWVDISTGHFYIQHIEERFLLDELLRLGPAECLLPQMRGELFEAELKKLSRDITQLTNASITERPSWYFEPVAARKRILRHFGVATLEGFGISDNDGLVCAAGAILEYLAETQKISLGHIKALKKIERKNYLHIDQNSLRSLEVLRTMRSESKKGSLLDCLDQTLTGMGARMFRSWLCMPLCDKGAIELRQDAVEDLFQNDALTGNIRTHLGSIADLERIMARVSTFRASGRDLVALGQTLRIIPLLRDQLQTCRADDLVNLASRCDSMDELADLIERAIEPQCPAHLRDGGIIKTGFDPELDRLRSISRDGKSFLAQYQQQEIERSGIANLKVGFNKVFGYYIEINHSQSAKVPPEYIRKQTVKNAERYITEELKQYEEQVLTAQDRSIELEQKLFEQVLIEAVKYVSRLQDLAQCIATIDCLCSAAYLARRRNHIRPLITNEKILNITDGKHPVLDQTLGSEFVPNDTQLGDDLGDVVIITGPNMAGKSTYIRQVALLTLMAQAGLYVPAKQAVIGVVDRIFTRVGASDELTRGQSTFMVEMTETATILNNATDRSLVILDEVGRGTSTYDGLALAWAITEHLARYTKSRTLFATHYHEITELGQLLENVKNYNVAVREWMDEVVFLHKIVPGSADKSYGIHVAKLAGVPRTIIDRAKEILSDLENTFAKEAAGENLSRFKSASPDAASLFVEKNKSVLDKLSQLDPNTLTPIEAITLLGQIKSQLKN